MLACTSINNQKMLSCPYSKRLIEKLRLINLDLPENSKIDIAEVEKGIVYAKYYHGDQKRDSGEPYYSHPLEVAFMVLDYLPRTDIIITAILHDTIEDTELTKEMITEVFGDKISEQVYDLTRIKEEGIKISSAQMVEELWLKKKYDILLVKLFDRIHNIRTVKIKSKEKAAKIISESLRYFLLLSSYLGMSEIEKEILSICCNKLGSEISPFKGSVLSFDGGYQMSPLTFQNARLQKPSQD
jgi:(p)ppGpp synthase/HD superfamily hydrolase